MARPTAEDRRRDYLAIGAQIVTSFSAEESRAATVDALAQLGPHLSADAFNGNVDRLAQCALACRDRLAECRVAQHGENLRRIGVVRRLVLESHGSIMAEVATTRAQGPVCTGRTLCCA